MLNSIDSVPQSTRSNHRRSRPVGASQARRPHLPDNHAMPCSSPPPEIPRLPHREGVPLQPTRFAQPASAAISIRPGTLECGRALGAVVARQCCVGTPTDDWLGRDVWCAVCLPRFPLPSVLRVGGVSVLDRRRYLGRERGVERPWEWELELAPAKESGERSALLSRWRWTELGSSSRGDGCQSSHPSAPITPKRLYCLLYRLHPAARLQHVPDRPTPHLPRCALAQPMLHPARSLSTDPIGRFPPPDTPRPWRQPWHPS